MPVQLELTDQEQNELIELLSKKKETILQDLEKVESTLRKLLVDKTFPSKMNGNAEFVNDSVSVRGTIGWKYKIDDVLKDYDGTLTVNQIVERMKRIEPDINPEVARKSVGSALSTNSRDVNGRYFKRVEKGLTYYGYNKDFKE